MIRGRRSLMLLLASIPNLGGCHVAFRARISPQLQLESPLLLFEKCGENVSAW